MNIPHYYTKVWVSNCKVSVYNHLIIINKINMIRWFLDITWQGQKVCDENISCKKKNIQIMLYIQISFSSHLFPRKVNTNERLFPCIWKALHWRIIRHKVHKSSKVNSIAPSHDSYRREVVLLALGNTHASLTVSWHTQTDFFVFRRRRRKKNFLYQDSIKGPKLGG